MPDAGPHDPTVYTSKSLAELAVLAQQGQMEAFRHIVERCNQALFRAAVAVLRDDDDAQDAVQDAYISAYRHIDSFRGDASLLTWLRRIVLNNCYRRLQNRHPTLDIETVETLEDESQMQTLSGRHDMDDPARHTARAEIRERVELAVMKLPDAFRVVFMLRDVEQCSVLETAEALDIRPETVKTRLFRARRLLRQSLQAELSSALADAFPFLGTRCAGLTDRVMTQLQNAAGDSAAPDKARTTHAPE